MLTRDVRTLEGQLADYNLAQDKARSRTDAEHLNHHLFALRERNEEFSRKLDEIFRYRQQVCPYDAHLTPLASPPLLIHTLRRFERAERF